MFRSALAVKFGTPTSPSSSATRPDAVRDTRLKAEAGAEQHGAARDGVHADPA